MGAWGEGPFENDDAADWVDEVGEALPAEFPGLIRAALQDVLDAAGENRDGFVESTEANRAVAAAVVVAATLPGGPPLDTEDVDPDEAGEPEDRGGAGSGVNAFVDLDPLTELVPTARAALSQVVRASEWRELWDDIDALDSVLAGLRPVLDTLGVTTSDPD